MAKQSALRIYVPNRFIEQMDAVIKLEDIWVVKSELLEDHIYHGKLTEYTGTWWQYRSLEALTYYDIPFKGMYEGDGHTHLIIYLCGSEDDILEVDTRGTGKGPIVDLLEDGQVDSYMYEQGLKYYKLLSKFKELYLN